jgi:hypothetical protein
MELISLKPLRISFAREVKDVVMVVREDCREGSVFGAAWIDCGRPVDTRGNVGWTTDGTAT